MFIIFKEYIKIEIVKNIFENNLTNKKNIILR